MKEVQAKSKRTEMKAGVYLVTITDMFYLKDAAKNIQTINGHPAIVVQFKNEEKEIHEQLYLIDGDVRQKYFQNMLNAAQVSMIKGSPTKSEVIGKRLYIAINEVHYVNDDVILLDENEKPLIDNYVFRVYPYTEGSFKPVIKGDPAKNNGIASDLFITYKNVSDSFTKEEVPTESIGIIKKTTTVEKKQDLEMPDFSIDGENENPYF